MSQSFSTVLVKDDRLNCKSSVKYAVEKGGANITASDVAANSATNTSHVYNVIVPSENIIVDRRVEWGATIKFRLIFNNLPDGSGAKGDVNQPYDLVQYGVHSSLSAYPLHSCSTTVSATINNNTVTANIDDILQTLIRFLDRSHIHKYNGITPTMPDNYLNYADAVNQNNNPLGSYGNSEKANDYHGRGSYVLLGIQPASYGSSFYTVYTGTGGANNPYALYVTMKTTEPLMLSPFTFSHDRVNSQGIFGIQNMSFRMNINPNARIWRQNPALTTSHPDTPRAIPVPTVQIDEFRDAKLTFFYLTPHPEDLFPSKNVVSFLDMPRYITQGTDNIPANTVSNPFTLQSVQLNMVPDKLVVLVRRKNLTVGDSDSFLPITNIQINWNNSSGILATAPQEKLWLMSVESGINQSWLEWSGKASAYSPGVDGGVAIDQKPYVPLAGGILALDFAKHIQINESYFAPGSLGVFSLQIRITCFNQDLDNTVLANNYEAVVIPVNSGVFVCDRGTSSQYIGILTKQDVIDASTKESYYRSDVDRLVGSGMMDNLKSSVGSAMLNASGMSGGGMSGGENNMKNRVA